MTETSKSIWITLTLKVTTVTMVGVHPCTYVTEDVNVCILEEGDEPNEDNCWNEQNCKNRRKLELFNENSEDDVVTADNAAGDNLPSTLALTLSIACLIFWAVWIFSHVCLTMYIPFSVILSPITLLWQIFLIENKLKSKKT